MSQSKVAPAYARGWQRIVIIALLSLVSLNAVAAGLDFIVKPDGSGLGIPQDWLDGTPFHDYLVPGVILLALGLLYTLAALRELGRAADAWFWTGLSGGAMIVWIVVQAAMMGSFRHPTQTILQAAILLIGIVLGLLASMQLRAWQQVRQEIRRRP